MRQTGRELARCRLESGTLARSLVVSVGVGGFGVVSQIWSWSAGTDFPVCDNLVASGAELMRA